jgi:hypothetical protein
LIVGRATIGATVGAVMRTIPEEQLHSRGLLVASVFYCVSISARVGEDAPGASPMSNDQTTAIAKCLLEYLQGDQGDADIGRIIAERWPDATPEQMKRAASIAFELLMGEEAEHRVALGDAVSSQIPVVIPSIFGAIKDLLDKRLAESRKK